MLTVTLTVTKLLQNLHIIIMLNSTHILIGSYLWHVREQTYQWHHHWQFFSLHYCKQTDCMLLCVCLVINHRRRQNASAARVLLFCSYHIVTSSAIYYWTDTWQHGIYLLNKWKVTHYRNKTNKQTKTSKQELPVSSQFQNCFCRYIWRECNEGKSDTFAENDKKDSLHRLQKSIRSNWRAGVITALCLSLGRFLFLVRFT